MNFENLPLEAQIQILKFCDDASFEMFQKFDTFKKFFSYPNEERIYEERSEHFFPKYIKYRNTTWKDFYDRVTILKKNEPLEYAKQCASKGKLMELQILHLDYPAFIKWELPLDIVCAEGHLELLQWFVSINLIPNVLSINLLADEAHLSCLEFLHSNYNLLPDTDGANWAAETGHLFILKWLAERNVFPDFAGANSAARNDHLDILNWLAEYNILPVGELYVKNPVIIDWLRERGLYTEMEQDL